MAPYASRLPFQLMLAPRSAAAALRGRRALGRGAAARRAVPAGAPPRLEPAAEPVGAHRSARASIDFCWRIDVLPRLTHLAGLELSTDVNLNIVAPEHAAAVLREA